MSVPSPFTPMNVITALMDILVAYPEDAYAESAKADLCRLRQRLGYSAPEVVPENFWCSSTNYEGFYDICRVFDQNDPRSKDIFTLYGGVLSKYNKSGFDKIHQPSER